MSEAYNHFSDSMDSAMKLSHIAFESEKSGMEWDVKELLWAELVLIVSAFDKYLHDITLLCMTNSLSNSKNSLPKSAQQFQLPLHIVKRIMLEPKEERRKSLFIEAFQEDNQKYSYQKTSGVNRALSLSNINPDVFWKQLAKSEGKKAEDCKVFLDTIIKNRNRIVHQSGVDVKGEDVTLEYIEKVRIFMNKLVLQVEESFDE